MGAGIAGIATAFFLLRSGLGSVLLLERDRVARGASGHNAGQLTTYFERPLSDIAVEFGWEAAAEAQRDVEEAHGLLDVIVGETGASVRVERFTGHMGMFNRHQLEVHLRCMQVRERAGLLQQTCVISEEAEFLGDVPAGFDGLYSVVPQARIRELLELDDDRYRAVLSAPAGCSSSAALCKHVLGHLQRTLSGPVRLCRLHQGRAGGGRRGSRGRPRRLPSSCIGPRGPLHERLRRPRRRGRNRGRVELAPDQRITGRVAYMIAFAEDAPRTPAAFSYIRNTTIGGETPYVYVTRRTYDRAAGAPVTLTCMGGPEHPFHEPSYDRESPFPGGLLQALDEQARPFAQPGRLPGRPYDFHWHGLMGYNDGGLRVVGAHPRCGRLLYNLGCNGVGFLPSIHGGNRIARLLTGQRVAASVFDPR